MSRRIAEPTRMRARDVIGEAAAVIAARPLRSALTGLGTVLAVAGFVAVLGLSSTAAGQVTSAFNQRLATEVRITVTHSGQLAAGGPFPPDTQRRLDALHGVVVAGMYWRLTIASPSVLPARPAGAPDRTARPTGSPPALVAATPGFLAAVGAQLSQGRLFGTWDQARAEPSCLLGAGAARRLGVTSVSHQPAVMIGGLPCTVVGIISHVRGQPWVIGSVLMPSTTAIAIWDSPPDSPGAEPGVLVRTRPGAAQLVARQAPLAISPDDPARYAVTVPPSPARLGSQVASILTGLFLTLAGISLLVGAASIANVMLLALAERTAEIGLRRALGARRRHIAAQILVESALLGLLGGIAGTSLGVIAVVLIAIARDWTPVIAPLTVLPAPLIGAAAGLVAGLCPSWRAVRIEPAEAMSAYPAT
ncbi:MAG TPA: FtsX-like permease family protein [Streptosporangiaceae bacterium]|nr:FtsX-like permease family protein [Streptosporangiaceae bacterium]